MNKYMKELSTLNPDALQKKLIELSEEVMTIQKSIKLGNTQNYHAATAKRREVARVRMLLSGKPEVKAEVKKPTKEKK